MKTKSSTEIIKGIRINFIRTWGYEPPPSIILEEINKYIDNIDKIMVLYTRQKGRVTEPERKQLYTDLIREMSNQLGAYLIAHDLVYTGKYEYE